MGRSDKEQIQKLELANGELQAQISKLQDKVSKLEATVHLGHAALRREEEKSIKLQGDLCAATWRKTYDTRLFQLACEVAFSVTEAKQAFAKGMLLSFLIEHTPLFGISARVEQYRAELDDAHRPRTTYKKWEKGALKAEIVHHRSIRLGGEDYLICDDDDIERIVAELSTQLQATKGQPEQPNETAAEGPEQARVSQEGK